MTATRSRYNVLRVQLEPQRPYRFWDLHVASDPINGVETSIPLFLLHELQSACICNYNFN
ncbi:MAG: hypothetical protein KME27_04650 [Lyngbya sp. HA4199-MV5]|nr:hypothetical protein [Lyngbya sp. HA4199-MV5]